MTLTKRQMEILSFIYKRQKRDGFSPTLGEIGQSLGISNPSVFEHLTALERKGAISRTPHESRSIEIIDKKFCEDHFEEDLRTRISRLEDEVAKLRFAMSRVKMAGRDA